MKLPMDVIMFVRDFVTFMQPNTPDAYEQMKAYLLPAMEKNQSAPSSTGGRLT
jgi:hypothetical protein